MDDGCREPQVLGIVEDRDGLSGKELGFFPATPAAVVCSTLESTLIMMLMIGCKVGVCVPYSLQHIFV